MLAIVLDILQVGAHLSLMIILWYSINETYFTLKKMRPTEASNIDNVKQWINKWWQEWDLNPGSLSPVSMLHY